MILPHKNKLPLDGVLTAKAGPEARIQDSIGSLGRRKLVKAVENGNGHLPSAPAQQMTPARQLALAKRAVSDRLARRHE
jgi:hypothetical protein